jgi:hypothetical protein
MTVKKNLIMYFTHNVFPLRIFQTLCNANFGQPVSQEHRIKTTNMQIDDDNIT